MAEARGNTLFELFTCVNCNTIRQCSYILGCFHVICGDCSENIKSNLKECCVLPRNPQELVPHPLNKQYASQLQNLYEVQSGDKEKHVCVICQDMEERNEDVMFCVLCASFWCQTHLAIHHRAMLKGNEHPFHRLGKEIELKDLLSSVQTSSLESSDRENIIMGQFIQKCEDIISDGKEHQKILQELNSTVDRWREMVLGDLEERFTVIRDTIDQLETEAKLSIEKSSQDTKERLELSSQENELKLRSVYRGIEMIQNIKNFCPNKVGEILSILTIDKIKEKCMTSFATFLLEMVPNISKINQELELDENQIIINAKLIEPNHTNIEFDPDKQLYEGGSINIIVQTCDQSDVPTFSTNSIIEMEINKIQGKRCTSYAKVLLKKNNYVKKSKGYTHKIRDLESSNYQVRVFINNSKVNKKWKFTVARDILSVKQPTINKLTGRGEAKAIAIHRNILYVSTPSIQEVDIYSIDGGFYTIETDKASSFSPRFEDSSRFFTPRFEIPRSISLSADSYSTRTFPNPKFGISHESKLGRGMLAGPHGICCYDDYVYVSDKVLHTVFCFTNIGAFIQKFGVHGSQVGEFMSPHGITINKTLKQLVVADRFNDRVQIVDLNTGSMIVVGYSENYLLKQPLDIAITMEDFYIVSTFKNDIVFYDNNFHWISILLSEIENPFHIAIDQTNQLYVSSYTEHRLYTILPLPHHGFNIQQVDIKDGQSPSGVAIGDDGTLYTVCHNTKETPCEQLLFGW